MKEIFFKTALAAVGLVFFSCAGGNVNVEEDNYPVTPISKSLAQAVQKYNCITSGFPNGLSIVRAANDCYGLIDLEGNEVLPCKFDRLEWTDGGYFYSFKSGYRGVIDPQGNEIVRCKYDHVHVFAEEGLISMSDESQYDNNYYNVWLANKKGEIIHEAEMVCEPCYFPSEGLVCAPDGSYLDYEGKKVIDGFDYSRSAVNACTSSPFFNGLAFVRDEGRSSVIDKTGKKVYTEEGNGVFDENGNMVLPSDYRLGYTDGQYGLIWQNDLAGIYDLKNKRVLVRPIFAPIHYVNLLVETSANEIDDKIKYFISQKMDLHYGIFVLDKGDNRFGVFNSEGKQIVPFTEGEATARIYPENRLICLRIKEFFDSYDVYYDFDGNKVVDGKELVSQSNMMIDSEIIFRNGYFICNFMDQGSVLNIKGEQILKVDGKIAEGVNEGVIVYRSNKDGIFKAVKLSGEEIKPDVEGVNVLNTPGNQTIGHFCEMQGGLIPVVKDGLCGYMNRAGETTFGVLEK